MSTERWQRLERIFAEARQFSVEAQTEFVARACGADETLRREALSLLAADDAPGEFMAKPALDRLAQSVASEGWSLHSGERIGAYTILRLLGAGGAGEVWRARDERLGRDVAIKILLPHFSSDAERLRRFAEEARAAGALNHSNILTVYDVGEHRGIPFLVSECLEGQNLRRQMDAGPLPVEEAVAIALGCARGLAAAHARGIIHRDLKPENTFIRSDGGVKILDFGMAKLQSALAGLPSDASQTMTGVIVGTAGYMAPEQVKGEQVDARTDLFALGVMLYEMLGGRHPFRRASTFDTLHAILTVEPPDLLTTNEHVPVPLARIVMRLLKKPPDARFQSALDLAWALEQVAAGPSDVASGVAQPSDSTPWWRSRRVAWLTAPIVIAVVLVGGWWIAPEAPRELPPAGLTQFTWTLPEGLFLDSAPVVSPDSQLIAFAGKDATGSRLYVRALGSRDAVAVSGTEGVMQPFWSPDSKSLGFFARGQLMKVAWPGGAPVVIASAPQPRGGAWSPSGVITFAPDVILAGLSRVSADGGSSTPATLLDVTRGDNSHWWPLFLPDGVHFLYFVQSINDERRGVYLGRGDRPASHAGSPLFRSNSGVWYAPLPGTSDGVLFYVVDGRMQVRRFDGARLTAAADARTIGFSAGESTLYHPLMLSASTDVLAFAESVVPSGNRLESVDRSGKRLRLWDEAEAQNWPRLSPDGRRLARQRVDPRNNPDIWVEDLERGTRVRVSTALEPDIQPVWSPDGRHLAYVSGNLPGRPGKRMLSIAAADGTGVVRSFPCPSAYCEPSDWSSDGRVLLVNVRDSRGWDVWTVSAEEGGTAQPLLAEAFSERDARFSPDGRWVAYVSEESGRSEVSVRAISGPPKRIVVSGNGGAQPVWRRDGAELFFVDPEGHLRSVSVHWSRDRSPNFGLPTQLNNVPPVGFGHWGTQYDVSVDGSQIYLLRRNEDQPPREIHVVIGWRALLD